MTRHGSEGSRAASQAIAGGIRGGQKIIVGQKYQGPPKVDGLKVLAKIYQSWKFRDANQGGSTMRSWTGGELLPGA